jgi:hypothetical protein
MDDYFKLRMTREFNIKKNQRSHKGIIYANQYNNNNGNL